MFLEKSWTKCGGELFPESFLKNLNWEYLWNKSLKVLFVFAVCQVKGLSIYIKLSCRLLAITSYRDFLKNNKRVLQLVSLLHFLYECWRKIFLLLHSIHCPNFIVWLLALLEIFGNMCIVILFNQSVTS